MIKVRCGTNRRDRKMVRFETGEEKLRAMTETGWNVYERKTQKIWPQITQTSKEGYNEDWKNGGHGNKCQCRPCRESFAPEQDEQEGYDKLMGRILQGNTPQRINIQTIQYQLQTIPDATDLRTQETRFKGSMIRMQQWLKEHYMYKQYGNAGYSGSLPRINCIIIDETDLYTKTATTEYYYHINDRHPRMGQLHENENIPRSNFSLDETLIVDISQMSSFLQADSFNTDKKKIKEILDVFGGYYKFRTGKEIPVYVIYGGEAFTKSQETQTAKERIQRIWSVLSDWALTPSIINWIGPGFGIIEVEADQREMYMMMTHHMVKRSTESFQRGVRAFNVFVHKNIYSANPLMKKAQQEELREQLQSYFQSGNPLKLPRLMKPGRPMQGAPPINGHEKAFKECQQCKQHEHCMVTPRQDAEIREAIAVLHLMMGGTSDEE